MRASLLVTALLVVPLLGTFGCKAETFGGDDPVIDPAEFTLVNGVPIAGNVITVSAPWMAGMPDSISIAMDDGPGEMAGRSEGVPDQFRILLPPSLPVGGHELVLVRSTVDRIPIGRLNTGGFTELRMVAGTISGPTQLFPTLPGLVGYGPEHGAECTSEVVLLDARQATLSTVPNIATCSYGVGASYLAAQFLFYQPWSGGKWIRMGMTLGAVTTDSLDVQGIWWPTHELAPGFYLQDQKQATYLVGGAVPGYQMLSYGDFKHPDHIAFSNDGRWVASSHTKSKDGLLIIDRDSRLPHWGPGWDWYTHPLFLPTGGLVAFGQRRVTPGGAYQEVLAHVDVETGAVIDSVRFADAGSPYDLPVALGERTWIVIPGLVEDHIELSIRDANTLQEIAHPRSMAVPSSCLVLSDYSVVEDPALHRFYVVGNYCSPQIPVLTFQLPE